MTEIEQKIQADLKSAMLARKSHEVATLKSLKTALQYVAVSGTKSRELDENTVISTLQKEAKKRVEAAELYEKAGQAEKARLEKAEKEMIQKYLPEMMEESELAKIIDQTIASVEELNSKNLGQIIGQVKSKTGSKADGADIARIVKSRMK